MSYTANQYNYCTPLSSSAGLVSGVPVVSAAAKLFTLSDNVLDGTYHPIVGDVGLWGTSISNADGVLAIPYVLTVVENLTLNAFRLYSSDSCYPVAFTITFYNGSTVVHTATESANNSSNYLHYFSQTTTVTSYVLTVTKISRANDIVRLYNVYNPNYIKRTDTLSLAIADASTVIEGHRLRSFDIIPLYAEEAPQPMTCGLLSTDVLSTNVAEAQDLHNIHSVMKALTRRVYGKVYITYTDPMLDSTTVITSALTAYNSNVEQIVDGIKTTPSNLFTLYNNDLTGDYAVSDASTQVGWTSSVFSGSDCTFSTPPSLLMTFMVRPIVSLSITFADTRAPADFSAVLTQQNGSTVTKTFVDNTATEVMLVDEVTPNVVSILITVTKAMYANSPITILDMPVASTFLYTGYKDESDLVSIDMLEELTYEDDIEALGGISANEATIVLDNSDDKFYFNNTQSPVASQLKRNRRIEPWLGAEVVPGEIEWYKLGTYWSYKWDVPVHGLTASVVGFDTIGLLDTTSFYAHTVQVNKSIGQLIEYVLNDAAAQFSFIQYSIDAALYDIVIPYAWFENDSHTAALRRISRCYPMHIYCDRNGRICAAPQRLHQDYFMDKWSDSTNIIDKKYSSLYTVVPNIVNVSVINPSVSTESLVQDSMVFTVPATRSLNFSKPYLSGLALTVDCDASVSYTYEVYSWGIVISFSGSGSVRSISCMGAGLSTDTVSVISDRDALSVQLNGAVTRNVSSEFIQTSALASMLISRLRALSEYDKYDASVDYRGDISLSINDPIILQNGIAPTDRYNIKRHQLYWDGALSGSADLNT